MFLLKQLLGAGYVPPACTGIFADVPCPATPQFPFSNFIEDLLTRGITGGCQVGPPALFCPGDPVTRAQMSVFLLKDLEGRVTCLRPAPASSPTCPARRPRSSPTPTSSRICPSAASRPAARSGPPALFCPDDPVTREQMAAFLSLTFDAVLYGP